MINRYIKLLRRKTQAVTSIVYLLKAEVSACNFERRYLSSDWNNLNRFLFDFIWIIFDRFIIFQPHPLFASVLLACGNWFIIWLWDLFSRIYDVDLFYCLTLWRKIQSVFLSRITKPKIAAPMYATLKTKPAKLTLNSLWTLKVTHSFRFGNSF